MTIRVSYRIGVAALALLSLTACDRLNRVNHHPFNGTYFRTSVKSERANRQNFTLTVRRAADNLEGAREAGRYAATKHCVKYRGTSDIIWSQGPDMDVQAFLTQGGELVLAGQCDG